MQEEAVGASAMLRALACDESPLEATPPVLDFSMFFGAQLPGDGGLF